MPDVPVALSVTEVVPGLLLNPAKQETALENRISHR
jgi:hypothetical protein